MGSTTQANGPADRGAETTREIGRTATVEYQVDDLKLRFHGPPRVMEDNRPQLDAMVRLFRAARSPLIESGMYDILLVLILQVTGEPEKELVGCAYERDSPEWERNRQGWPPFARDLITGDYVAISWSGIERMARRFGGEAALVDWADTLNHELVHLNTGVEHEGHDDICLQDAERFLRKVLLFQPLDGRAEAALLRVASVRRKTGHG